MVWKRKNKLDRACIVSIPIKAYFKATFDSKNIVERAYKIICPPPHLNVKSFKKGQFTSHNLPHKTAENFY
jgi:hypothetical protein